ncbi:unnamed protein product [Amoebophrya sp. A25]|nr:unnamed protein product [Amoebophrya sp. A25]|eukprot:GSA25T00027339001.1
MRSSIIADEQLQNNKEFAHAHNDGILNLLFDYRRSDRGTPQHNYGFLYDRLFLNEERCDVQLVGEIGVGPLQDRPSVYQMQSAIATSADEKVTASSTFSADENASASQTEATVKKVSASQKAGKSGEVSSVTDRNTQKTTQD